MKFAAIIEYIQDKEKIQSIRPAHRQYLTSLLQAGQPELAIPVFRKVLELSPEEPQSHRDLVSQAAAEHVAQQVIRPRVAGRQHRIGRLFREFRHGVGRNSPSWSGAF